MSSSASRPLRVFICHSSGDKPAARELYRRLDAEGWINAWLDEEKLYPGQDWNLEIEKAVEAADIILVCLTNNSVNKEGYIQRELRIVLDLAEYKPEGTLFVIPIRLEECEPPRRLRHWQYADYFPQNNRDRAYGRLLVSLRNRAISLGIATGRSERNSDVDTLYGKASKSSPQRSDEFAGTQANLPPQKSAAQTNEWRPPTFPSSIYGEKLQGRIKIYLSPKGDFVSPLVSVSLDREKIKREPSSSNKPYPREIFNELVKTGEHKIEILWRNRKDKRVPMKSSISKFNVANNQTTIITFREENDGWLIQIDTTPGVS